ncbi:class I adenylate-forming enzyme family protein [Rhodococcus erythropolis]|uniref:class I adenylate-forming enzyme family protein n=1 Tax=Rhodococcus erythropolis TaxID=1833 RepID=UPI00222734BF|nr:AMP-binding protein [Rhodococcus erythropolis]MCW2295442.1 acyl-CoA synthetase (AMP-forming)/AMP-acid ligase II [Rhodococcus erythropolis]
MPHDAHTQVISLSEVYDAAYATFGERIATRDGNRSITYTQLGLRAYQLARGMRGLGLKMGDRVLLVAPNSCEWTEVDHALTRGGLVRVALLSRLHPHELAQIAHDAEPAALIADGEWLSRVGQDWVPDSVRHRIVLGESVEGALSLDDVAAADRGAHLAAIGPEALLWIGYTSGSTGLPKGVLNTNRGLGATARNIVSELPTLTQSSVVVHSAPLSHFTGAIAAAATSIGATNLCVPSFDCHHLIELIEQRRADVMPLVPTQINMLVDVLRQEGAAGRVHDMSGLALLPYAGSAIAPDRAAAATKTLGAVLTQFYGSSEAPMPVTALQPQDHTDDPEPGSDLPLLASAGRVNRFCSVRILDADGHVLETGAVGEIAVSGDQTSPGYWRNDDATAQLFDKDGWVRTGDVGYLNSDNYLFIVDRKKDMVVTGGFNVYPREIENVISTCPGVREVAVVGAPHSTWGEQIVAVISLNQGAHLSIQDIEIHCRERLGGYKVPKSIEIVSELPKLGNGKVDKRQIREKLWAHETRRV